MTKKTHLCVGIALTLPIIYTFFNPISLLGILGSIAPDWDLKLGIKHRTITHSLLALIISTSIIYIFSSSIAIVFALNYLLHLILDSLTKMGVPFLYPFKNRYYGLKLIRTGGTEDLCICAIAIAFITLII
ncbi:metal-dependent hydrolase [Clostridium botulinum]|nr:metal-dependent hydrolase [Clostridium botulinum]